MLICCCNPGRHSKACHLSAFRVRDWPGASLFSLLCLRALPLSECPPAAWALLPLTVQLLLRRLQGPCPPVRWTLAYTWPSPDPRASSPQCQ